MRRREFIIGAGVGAASLGRARAASLIRPNPLAFPGTLPRFNRGLSPATATVLGHGICAVASGNNFVDLLSGQLGTINGAPTAAMTRIGPAVKFISGASITFPGRIAISENFVTMGGIFFLTTGGSDQSLFASSSNGTNGTQLRVNSTFYGTGPALVNPGQGQQSSGFANLSAGIPYALFASMFNQGNQQVNFVLRRLDNGQTTKASFASGAGGAGTNSGTYIIGNDSGGEFVNGYVAAAMFSPIGQTLGQLDALAAEPWLYWYQRTVLQTLAWVATQGSAPASVYHGLPLLGVGN